MSVNAQGQPVFHGTSYTHEVVHNGVRFAYAEDLTEAKIVACALSRILVGEVRVYAAFADLPHSSYRTGWEVR